MYCQEGQTGATFGEKISHLKTARARAIMFTNKQRARQVRKHRARPKSNRWKERVNLAKLYSHANPQRIPFVGFLIPQKAIKAWQHLNLRYR